MSRPLAALPLAAAGAVVLAGAAGETGCVNALAGASKLVALFGCLVAALAFPARDALFRGWILQAATFALLVQRDAILHRGLLGPLDAPHVAAIESALLVTANGCGLIGTWFLARAWHVPGTELPGAAAMRAVLRTAAIVLALFITAPSLWVNVEEILGGSLQAASGAVTVIVDAAALAMIAPVALTVIALRQESVGWPWALLTASLVAWLCYDASIAVRALVGSRGPALGVTAEMFRVFACTAAGMAGLAQRRAPR
jgi:hypothetical protein